MNTTCDTRAGVTCWARTDLLDDLRGVEVLFEAGLARRAEGAAHGASRLGRNADRRPVGAAHQHRFHLRAVAGLPEPLDRHLVFALAHRHWLERERECFCEPRAEVLRQTS
jgi:hypothetical protein